MPLKRKGLLWNDKQKSISTTMSGGRPARWPAPARTMSSSSCTLSRGLTVPVWTPYWLDWCLLSGLSVATGCQGLQCLAALPSLWSLFVRMCRFRSCTDGIEIANRAEELLTSLFVPYLAGLKGTRRTTSRSVAHIATGKGGKRSGSASGLTLSRSETSHSLSLFLFVTSMLSLLKVHCKDPEREP